jgi:UDP-N-acetylglucosamine diphosphorylase/glucosamine-1-phosphate N-acetyltransferase
MPHLCLFEDATVRHLLPLAATRAAGDLRVGIQTLAERQRRAFALDGLFLHTRASVARVAAQAHPQALVNTIGPNDGVLFVNQRWLVEEGDLVKRLRAAARPGQPACAFHQGDTIVAAWHPNPPADLIATEFVGHFQFEGMPEERVEGAALISRLWHLLDDVPARIAADFDRLTRSSGSLGLPGNEGTAVHPSATLVDPERIYLAPGATVRPGAILNAERGPIYLAEGAVVEEGAIGIGPLYLGPHARLKAAARAEGSAVGLHSKVGGEVHDSIVHSFSNKSHDGYLGNSYLGQWCNLGADTNTSNLKNDYGHVTVYDAVAEDFVDTERQFVGLVMGDHSKCSINTMFNTGTVVGVFCNLFGAGFPPRWVPGFSWGGADGLVPYRVDKALRVAEAVMARRDVPLTDANRAMLEALAAAADGPRTSEQ